MAKKSIPEMLWDFVVSYVFKTHIVTASGSIYAIYITPLEIITSKTPNIFKYLDFGVYDWVTFWRIFGAGPPELGRWPGVYNRTVPQISYLILTPAGQFFLCATVHQLTNLEHNTEAWRNRMEAYDKAIETHSYVK